MQRSEEPGRSPNFELHDAVLSSTNEQFELHMGGVVVRVTLPAGSAPWMHRYEAFMKAPTEGPADFSVNLEIKVGDPAVEAPLGDFTYDRMDLAFGMDSQRQTAQGTSNGSESGFLALLELALQGALLARGSLMVHAVSGLIDGRAWLVPGPSGTGKSTAAREAGFDSVLSDERVILTPDADGWRVWGTPFWSEGRTLPMNPGSAPLAGIVKLVKSPDNGRRSLEPNDALTWLMQSITLYEDSDIARTRAFEQACTVISGTPAIEQKTPRNFAWAAAGKRAA